MELLRRSKVVRIRSHHDEKYMASSDDNERVIRSPIAAVPGTIWIVEWSSDAPFVRLKSYYSRYLTASDEIFGLGESGRKVLLLDTANGLLADSPMEWEPIRRGSQVTLKSKRYGTFLRANGDSVTHDAPRLSSTKKWALWDVEVVQIYRSPSRYADSSTTHSSRRTHYQKPARSLAVRSKPKAVGRTIFFAIADDDGSVGDGVERPSFTFEGSSIGHLTNRIEEVTQLRNIILCSWSPANGKLFPLHLPLPPGNAARHVVVVHGTFSVARSFKMPKNPLENGMARLNLGREPQHP